MTLLIFYVALALGVSFLCSILEAVLLSVSPSYVAALQSEGSRVGNILSHLKSDIDRPLASILSVNTVAHTVGAAGAGAQALKVFGEGSVALFSAFITLAILFLSEIIPKTLGANYWRELAPFTARVLPPMILLTLPLVWASRFVVRLVSRGRELPTLSREEMTALTEIGEREQVISQHESRVLRNVLRFGDVLVRDVMTPRTVVLAADEDLTVAEFWEAHPNPTFSRIPIYREDDVDDVTGYVLKYDMLLKLARDEDEAKLRELRRDITVVPESQSVRELFDTLVRSQEHIALVVDEYGGMAGVVTMEDVVETLLGLEIVDESDVTQDMRALARQQWYARAYRLGLVPAEFERADRTGEQATGEGNGFDHESEGEEEDEEDEERPEDPGEVRSPEP